MVKILVLIGALCSMTFTRAAIPKINVLASPTPVYSFVGNKNPVPVTCDSYGYPVPIVKMFTKDGTEIARENQSVSIDIIAPSEDDFGVFNCTAENAEGTADYSVELKLAGPPGPPRDVKIEAICDNFTLRWLHPLDNGGMPITNYVITILLDGNALQIRNVDRHAQMHEFSFRFQPETSYELRLKARNEPGTGNEEIMFITTDELCVPGKPTIANKEMKLLTEQMPAKGPDLVLLMSSLSLTVLCIILVILVRIIWSLRRKTRQSKDMGHRAKKSDQPEEYEEIELSPPAMMVPSDRAKNPDNVQASSAFSHLYSHPHAPIEAERKGEHENLNQTQTSENANLYMSLTNTSNLET